MSPLAETTRSRIFGAPRALLFPLACCFLLALAGVAGSHLGCAGDPETGGPHATKYVASRQVMSTLADLTLIATDPAGALAGIRGASAALDQVEARMSAYRSESDVARINREAGEHAVEVAAETFKVISEACRFSRLTGGAFDITVGPLIELWREAARRGALPSAEELKQARAKVGAEKLILDAGARTVAFEIPGMRIDLGAIAKGYALDRAALALTARASECGIENASEGGSGDASEGTSRNAIEGGVIEVGGDLLAFGRIPAALILAPADRLVDSLRASAPVALRDFAAWPLGVQSPFDEGLLGKIRIPEGALATSGHYRRFVEIAGHRYSHIIDPRTGLPAEEPASVTVWARDGLTADALATGITVLGLEKGLALADSLPDVEALVVTGSAADPVLHATPGFPALEPLGAPGR